MLTPEQNQQAAQSSKSNRRRQYIVHPKVQWKHALTLGAAVFLFCVILSCGLFATLHAEARQRVINPAAYTGSVLTVIVTAALTYSAVTAGVIAFWMIVSTHRICGPVYVLEQSFEELAQGRIPRLRPLRSKDEFKDVFATFSRAVDRIRQDKESCFAALNRALAETRADAGACEQEHREVLESVAHQLQELRNQLAQSLDKPAPSDRAARPQCLPGAV